MSAFSFDTQRAALTIVAFIGTFIVALSFGRFLKRRAEVRLGILYQLFCLALAFYVALAVYGLEAPWRVHVGAAAILLSTALIVALVNRYVWDIYFERRKQTPIPHFLREVVALVIFCRRATFCSELCLSCRARSEERCCNIRGRSRNPRLGWSESSRRHHCRHVVANQSPLQSDRLAKGGGYLRRSDGDQLALDAVAHERRHLPRHSEQRNRQEHHR